MSCAVKERRRLCIIMNLASDQFETALQKPGKLVFSVVVTISLVTSCVLKGGEERRRWVWRKKRKDKT